MSRMSTVKNLLAIVAVMSVVLLSRRAEATHFRYGNITYSIVDPVNAPTTVRFVVTTAWRASFIDGTALDFGDGNTDAFTTGFQIGTGVDASGLQYAFTQYAVTHTYPAIGQYVAQFNSCCRLSTLINAGDQNFRVEAKVDLTAGNTGNPVAAVPAIIQLQTGGVRTIDIAATDPDGTPVACRFANYAESGSGITTNPPVVNGHTASIATNVNPPGCRITWDTTGGAAGSQYATQVKLESTNGPNVNSAALDFIIELVASPPPKCLGSGLFNVDQGESFSTTVVGTNNSGGPTLTMTSVGLLGAVTPVPGTTAASPFTSTLIAIGGAPGAYVQTVVYTDQLSVSGFCTIAVNVPACPAFGQDCSVGIGECTQAGYLVCDNGGVVCNALPGPPAGEVCDGLDNDCDGVADNGDPESGIGCSTGLPGACSEGLTSCPLGAGTLSCIGLHQPGDIEETCNGVDDDCDGQVDEGFNAGEICVVGEGACQAQGFVICDGLGGTKCSVQAGSLTPEVCNGVDDDCNDIVDDGFDVGAACTTGLGACQVAGAVACDANGGTTCDATPGEPSAEVCGNGIDEDCDGALDNGCADGDSDGVFDEVEIGLGMDPADADSDDDGVPDGLEPSFAVDFDGDGVVNALDPDSDNDGLYDGTELGYACSGAGTDKERGHCIADGDGGDTKTNPLDADTDGGSGRDGSEDANLNGRVDAGEGDPNVEGDDAVLLDTDTDGLSDALEAFIHSDPSDADTDDDGVSDGDEANPADDTDGDGLVNVLDVDSDNDALLDGTEVGAACAGTGTNAEAKHCLADGDSGATTTSAIKWDTDGGGTSDGSEDVNLNGVVDSTELDPANRDDDAMSIDSDGDGLTDLLEVTLGSKAGDVDSDNDGLLDGDEPNASDDRDGDGKIDVLDWDSDGDGLFDGTEAGKACDSVDTDVAAGHCAPDADSGATTTSVLNKDSDWATALDGEEDTNKNGAVDPGERNPLDPSDDIVATGCKADGECGDAASGKICDVDSGACVDGCHGTDGNGCPEGQECTSTDATAGTCKDIEVVTPPPPAEPEKNDPSGCSCRTAGSEGGSDLPVSLLLAGIAGVVVRRRRRAA